MKSDEQVTYLEAECDRLKQQLAIVGYCFKLARGSLERIEQGYLMDHASCLSAAAETRALVDQVMVSKPDAQGVLLKKGDYTVTLSKSYEVSLTRHHSNPKP